METTAKPVPTPTRSKASWLWQRVREIWPWPRERAAASAKQPSPHDPAPPRTQGDAQETPTRRLSPRSSATSAVSSGMDSTPHQDQPRGNQVRRKLIRIDADLCTGCGSCLKYCPEGALQMVGGRAVLAADEFCDGLGICVRACPQGAILLEERLALPFDLAGSAARRRFSEEQVDGEFRRRLTICCRATLCGRICRRLVKEPGRTGVWCVDLKAFTRIYLYEALAQSSFKCPEGYF